MSAFALSPDTRRLALEGPFLLESGAVLPRVEIAYRTWGALSHDADNAVIVCHALTGSADADAWWTPLIGSDRALDPMHDFIVCSNVLGGCYGTTGPSSLAPDGRPWEERFPRVTLRDQVNAQIALADALGVRGIRLVIGGSMGGLQALEWALLDPARVAAVAAVAASARHSPWCIVWSEAQRMALAADPNNPPLSGLAAARAIAMITYRSAGSLDRRFGRARGAEVFGTRSQAPDDFAARGWLRHHGNLLLQRFDAHTYRVLLDAMDTHDLGRGRGELDAVLGNLFQPTLVVSIPSDGLYVPADQHALARALPDAVLADLESSHGHDGFLIDADRLNPIVRDFRDMIGVQRLAPTHAVAGTNPPSRRHDAPLSRPRFLPESRTSATTAPRPGA
ncbi:MAG: homoserine O-acetyltransferase [Burkholderiales bacterium]